MKNKFKCISMLSLIFLLGIITLSGCSNKNKDIDLTNTIVTSSIQYGEDNWEVHKSTVDNKIYILKNGELEDEKTDKENELKAMITIPVVESSKDLDKSDEITHYTYKSGIVSSLEYLNYLAENGYTEKLRAKTPDFLEVYLKSDKMDKYKRIIITKDYIVEYNTDNLEFKIDNYII